MKVILLKINQLKGWFLPLNNQFVKYNHIFFDLDHTLWDYDRNAAEALQELIDSSGLVVKYPQITTNRFVSTYHQKNRLIWEQYNQNKITKQQLRASRFNLVLQEFGVNDPDLALHFENGFFVLCPSKTHTFPHAHLALNYLSQHYQLHIITNGFDETQAKKMMSSNIDKYFKKVVTSESMGYRKPDSRIFEFAMQEAGAMPSNSLMVGDNIETDIEGAKAVGIDQVLFDPDRVATCQTSTFTISCLSELTKML